MVEFAAMSVEIRSDRLKEYAKSNKIEDCAQMVTTATLEDDNVRIVHLSIRFK